MTPEEREEVAPAADNFESLFGARDKKPVSVKAAETAIGFTPVGSAVEIGEELSKEDPSYGKVALIAAGDVLGTALPAAAPVVKTLIGSGRGLVRDVDDLVDTWSRGDISNKELRDSAKELGVTIETKRITKNRDASDIQISMPDGKVYTGVDTIPNPDIDPEYVKGLTKNAETDALQELGLTEEALEAWKAKNYSKDKYRVARIEKLEDAAKALREGEITSAEFRELSDAYQPIVPIEEMPNFPTKEEVVQALHATDKRKVAKGIVGVNKTIQDGTPISARLDIPAYNDTDTWVVSLHDGTAKNGDTVGYAQTAVLNDVKFTTNPLAASAISAGNTKTTIARMNGSYINAKPEEVYDYAKEILENNPEEWSQVGMNPYRASYFYDKADGMPVTSADQVIQVGPLVFARNVKKTTPDDEMFEFTNKRTGVTANFSEGGMALEEQMAMNFGDVPDNTVGIDPVSGNEIPLGSTAENVRDDIPAQLSEGELVIPADVVNYHGVKLFEDLRAEAKMGYAQMNEDGRMGGEPLPIMEEDGGLDIVIADLEVVDDMSEEEPEEAFLGKFFAGIREQNKKQDEYNKSVQQTFDNAKDRQSVKNIKASAGKPKKKKFKNNFEKIMYNLFGDDDEPAQPPSKRKDKPKIDFGFGGNPMERASRKYGTEPTETKNESYRDTPKSVSRGYTPNNPSETFAEYLNFGGKYDEGGMAVALPGKTGQMLPDDYDPLVDSVGGQMTTGEVEMREYRNSAGHTILIPFMDGVPMAVIPEGYYPVGSEPIVPPTGGSSGGGSGGGGEMQPTEPFNYKELTITELVDEVKNLQTTPQFAGTNLLTGVLMFAQKSHKNKTIKEIERRLDDPELDLYNREYLENLLEVAKAPAKKGALGKTIDKILGKEEQEDPPTVEDAKPEYDFSGPDAEGYEPTTSAKPSPSSTVPDFTNKEITEARQASADAAAKAFGTPSKTVEPTGQEDFIAAVKQDPASFLPPTPPSQSDDDDDTPSTGGYDPVGTGSVDDPSRKPTRSGGGGRNKGGMMQKKKKAKKKK